MLSIVRRTLIAALVLFALSCPMIRADVVPASDPNLIEVAAIDLARVEKGRGVLPAEFCNRADLVYDVTITAHANWNSSTDKRTHGLFVLGRNINGPRYANSVSLLVYNGGLLFARMTSSTLSDTAQVVAETSVTEGQPYSIHARWSASSISLDCNGKHLGDCALSGGFVWPNERPYNVGAEDAGFNLWDGTIDAGTLRVYKPVIAASFGGGNDAGYYLGGGSHELTLDVRAAGAKPVSSSLSVTDIDGNTVLKELGPSRSTASGHSFTLPSLPFGWYSATASLTDGSAHVVATRPFVISRQVPERDAAAASPFGIATELEINPARYDGAYAEGLMKRISQMGCRWLRIWVGWDAVQKTPDQFEWRVLDDVVARAQKYGLNVYPCLCNGSEEWQCWKFVQAAPYLFMSDGFYAPRDMNLWNRYVSAMAARYKGRIGYYQVFNEVDARNSWYPYSTAGYVDVLSQTAKSIRSVDPTAKVATGGFCAGYAPSNITKVSHTDKDAAYGLGEFWANNPQAGYDIMDCHFYAAPGAAGWDPMVDVVRGLRQAMIAHGDSGKEIWDSETAWQTGEPGSRHGGTYISGKEQAVRLVQLHVQSLAAGVSHTFWYGFRGEYGVLNTDFSPRPSYAAHSELATILAGLRFEKTLDLGATTRGYQFTNGKRSLIALWTTAGQNSLAVHGKGRVSVSDMMGNQYPLPPTGALTVGTVPIYVEGDTADFVSIVR
ncbi:MAG TPA: hypothetical protein VGK19_17435 [Capsulimonadaceae bacterium]|jgi:hypothetical protein